jgi:hypothetical protein
MTEDQARQTARELAAERGWAWVEPVRVRAARAWWVGPLRWRVWSNHDSVGMNVHVELDDATGKVLSAHFLPR